LIEFLKFSSAEEETEDYSTIITAVMKKEDFTKIDTTIRVIVVKREKEAMTEDLHLSAILPNRAMTISTNEKIDHALPLAETIIGEITREKIGMKEKEKDQEALKGREMIEIIIGMKREIKNILIRETTNTTKIEDMREMIDMLRGEGKSRRIKDGKMIEELIEEMIEETIEETTEELKEEMTEDKIEEMTGGIITNWRKTVGPGSNMKESDLQGMLNMLI